MLIRPTLGKRFAARLLPNTSRIRAFDKIICEIAGILPVTLEIDGIERRIDFRAVPEIQQEVLLGTEFCKTFKLRLMQFEGLWSTNRSECWYGFSSEKNGTHPILIIKARLAGITRMEDLGNAGVGTMKEMTCFVSGRGRKRMYV